MRIGRSDRIPVMMFLRAILSLLSLSHTNDCIQRNRAVQRAFNRAVSVFLQVALDILLDIVRQAEILEDFDYPAIGVL
jgi:hypothetical protein